MGITAASGQAQKLGLDSMLDGWGQVVVAAGVAQVPQPPAPSQAGADLVSLAEGLSSLTTFFFLSPPLKSVSYQPPPLSRNPTTEISFFSSG